MSLASVIPVFGQDARPGTLPPGKGQDAPKRSRDPLSQLYKRIEDECEAGLPNERQARLDGARTNQDFYSLNFTPYTQAWVNLDRDAIRTSAIMQRVVEVLTADLYRVPPTRTIADSPAVTDWLNTIYRANATDALIQEADRLGVVNQVAAIEVQGAFGPGSESKPIEHVLWGGDSFVIWRSPDNPRKPIAVATIDLWDNQRRLRLWTDRERIVYVTDKLKPGQTSGGRVFKEQDRSPNPYVLIPFTFFHFRFPTVDFWGGSPGDNLRQLNNHINYRLSKTAHDIIKWRPVGVVEGARPDFNFPKDYVAGDYISIPPAVIDAGGGSANNPEVKHVVPDLSYLAQDWDDLQKYLDHTLEMHGVPASAVRLEQKSAVSGIAIFAEQIPIVRWAEGRQKPFGYYERDLCRVTCAVAAAHAEANGVPDLLGCPVEELVAVADDPDLSLQWKSQLAPLLAMQRAQWDVFRFQQYLVSRTQYNMELGMTREEAEAQVVQTAQDLERENELFAALQPTLPGMAPAPTVEAGQQNESEGQPENASENESATNEEGSAGNADGEQETGEVTIDRPTN